MSTWGLGAVRAATKQHGNDDCQYLEVSQWEVILNLGKWYHVKKDDGKRGPLQGCSKEGLQSYPDIYIQYMYTCEGFDWYRCMYGKIKVN